MAIKGDSSESAQTVTILGLLKTGAVPTRVRRKLLSTWILWLAPAVGSLTGCLGPAAIPVEQAFFVCATEGNLLQLASSKPDAPRRFFAEQGILQDLENSGQDPDRGRYQSTVYDFEAGTIAKMARRARKTDTNFVLVPGAKTQFATHESRELAGYTERPDGTRERHYKVVRTPVRVDRYHLQYYSLPASLDPGELRCPLWLYRPATPASIYTAPGDRRGQTARTTPTGMA